MPRSTTREPPGERVPGGRITSRLTARAGDVIIHRRTVTVIGRGPACDLGPPAGRPPPKKKSHRCSPAGGCRPATGAQRSSSKRPSAGGRPDAPRVGAQVRSRRRAGMACSTRIAFRNAPRARGCRTASGELDELDDLAAGGLAPATRESPPGWRPPRQRRPSLPSRSHRRGQASSCSDVQRDIEF